MKQGDNRFRVDRSIDPSTTRIFQQQVGKLLNVGEATVRRVDPFPLNIELISSVMDRVYCTFNQEVILEAHHGSKR